jgi:hypothetical protein
MKVNAAYPIDLIDDSTAGPVLKPFLRNFFDQYSTPENRGDGEATLQYSVYTHPLATKSVVFQGYSYLSLLIAKLHASGRQSTLAKALHEYGRLVRTVYVCRYVADEELRRRVRRQLNKGESLHALRRDLFFAHQSHVQRRHLDDQIDQALCLTLVTNACVLWTTTYLGDTIDALRADGIKVTDEIAAHLTPAQHDHINFYGTYSFDIDAELRRDGRRPLRIPA